MALVQMKLSNGAELLVEAAETPDAARPQGMQPVGIASKATAVMQSMEDAMAQVGPLVETVLAGLRDTAQRVDELSATFGFKLAAEGGVILAKTAVEGSFSVTIRWRGGRSPE